MRIHGRNVEPEGLEIRYTGVVHLCLCGRWWLRFIGRRGRRPLRTQTFPLTEESHRPLRNNAMQKEVPKRHERYHGSVSLKREYKPLNKKS